MATQCFGAQPSLQLIQLRGRPTVRWQTDPVLPHPQPARRNRGSFSLTPSPNNVAIRSGCGVSWRYLDRMDAAAGDLNSHDGKGLRDAGSSRDATVLAGDLTWLDKPLLLPPMCPTGRLQSNNRRRSRHSSPDCGDRPCSEAPLPPPTADPNLSACNLCSIWR
jgi:hypothetical protein